jgi:hypothetical protein
VEDPEFKPHYCPKKKRERKKKKKGRNKYVEKNVI